MNSKNITFNNKNLFSKGTHTVITDSWQRESIDHAFAGLSGVISVDLGRRKRKLKQLGTLVAESIRQMTQQINAISNYIDGQSYSLIDQQGNQYNHVRMDSFTLKTPTHLANHVQQDYEITYTQLSQ